MLDTNLSDFLRCLSFRIWLKAQVILIVSFAAFVNEHVNPILKRFGLVMNPESLALVLTKSKLERKLLESKFSLLYFRYVTIISEGCKALSGSQDKSFRVWDLNTSAYLKQDRTRGHSEGIIDIAVTRDGAKCVSGSMDGTFKVWKCETAEECFTLQGSQKIIHYQTDSSVQPLFPVVDKSGTSGCQG